MSEPVQYNESLKRTFGHTFHKNEVIFCEGDRGGNVFLIVKGRIQIFTSYHVSDKHGSKVSETGKIHELCVLSDGDIFGEMSLLNNLPRSATARAIEDTEVLMFNNEDFYVNMAWYPQLAVRFLKLLSQRVRDMDEKLKSTLGYADYLEYQLELLKTEQSDS